MGNLPPEQTAYASLEAAKLVEDTIFWYENKIEFLTDIAESNTRVKFSLGDDEDIELSERESRIFFQGIKTAIQHLGDFLLSLDRPTSSIDLKELEN